MSKKMSRKQLEAWLFIFEDACERTIKQNSDRILPILIDTLSIYETLKKDYE